MDIERELSVEAGCAVDREKGGPLLVAITDDAIVNDEGRIVHLRTSAREPRELEKGGLFTGGGLRIKIEREHRIERIDEVTTWQATIRVARGVTGVTSFHHRWSCGV
jgi:hypothetical protein